MKNSLLLILLFVPSLALSKSAKDYDFSVQPTCVREKEGDEFVYSNEFKWNVTLEEMKVKFEELYKSSKRLKHRAYFDLNRGVYVMELENYSGPKEGWTPMVLPPHFVKSVIRHVELALTKRYADFIFFPDMGHSHFYFPLKHEEEYKKVITSDDKSTIYQWLVNLKDLKMLYHTAEQLKMREDNRGPFLTDREIQWRYYSRNPVGDNMGGETISPIYAWKNQNFNTVGELDGHRDWSSGFNIHANVNGCFPYIFKGVTYYFDLSWYDLGMAPGTEMDEYSQTARKKSKRIPASKKR